MTLGQLRTIVREAKESRLNRIKVGPVMGSPQKGFTVRLTKDWHFFENETGSWRLRKAVHSVNPSALLTNAWLGRDFVVNSADNEHFVDVELRSADAPSARLERDAFVGNLERLGFEVDATAPAKLATSHPYR